MTAKQRRPARQGARRHRRQRQDAEDGRRRHRVQLPPPALQEDRAPRPPLHGPRRARRGEAGRPRAHRGGQPVSRRKRWRLLEVLIKAELPEVAPESIDLELLGEVKPEEPESRRDAAGGRGAGSTKGAEEAVPAEAESRAPRLRLSFPRRCDAGRRRSPDSRGGRRGRSQSQDLEAEAEAEPEALVEAREELGRGAKRELRGGDRRGRTRPRLRTKPS